MVLHGYYCDVDGGCDNINAQKYWLTSKRVSFLSSFCPRPSTRFVCEPTFSQKNISIYVMFIDRYDVPYTDCVGIVLLMLCFFDHGIDTCIQSKRSQRALWPQQKPPMWWSQQKPAVPSGRLPGMTKPAAESLKCWPQKISTRCFQEVSRLLRVHMEPWPGGSASRYLQDFLRFPQLACIIVRKKGICFPQCSPSFGDACQLTGTGQKPFVLIEPWWGSFCSAFWRLDSREDALVGCRVWTATSWCTRKDDRIHEKVLACLVCSVCGWVISSWAKNKPPESSAQKGSKDQVFCRKPHWNPVQP